MGLMQLGDFSQAALARNHPNPRKLIASAYCKCVSPDRIGICRIGICRIEYKPKPRGI